MATDKIKYDTVTLQCTRENPPYCVATKVTESGIRGSYEATRTELDTMGATSKKTFTDFYDTTKKPTHALKPRSTIQPPKTGAPPPPPPPSLTLTFKGAVDTVRSKNYEINDSAKIPNLPEEVVNTSSELIVWDIIDTDSIITFDSKTGTITNLNKSGEVAVTASIGTDAKTQQLTFNINILDSAIKKSSPKPSLSLDPSTPSTNVTIKNGTRTASIPNKFINPTSAPIIWSSSKDKVATVLNGTVTIVEYDLITTTPPVTITASVGSSDTQQVVFTLVPEPESTPKPETEKALFEFADRKNSNIYGMVGTAIDLNGLVTVTPEGTDIVWTTEETDKSAAFLTPPTNPTAFIANREGIYVVNGTVNGKKLKITITVDRPTIKIADGRDTTITKTPESLITLNEDYVTVTNIPIRKVKWTANGNKMTDNILSLDDPANYELIGTVGEGTETDNRVIFNVTVTPSSGGRRRTKGSKGSKGTMKVKLGKLRRRMGTRVKRA